MNKWRSETESDGICVPAWKTCKNSVFIRSSNKQFICICVVFVSHLYSIRAKQTLRIMFARAQIRMCVCAFAHFRFQWITFLRHYNAALQVSRVLFQSQWIKYYVVGNCVHCTVNYIICRTGKNECDRFSFLKMAHIVFYFSLQFHRKLQTKLFENILSVKMNMVCLPAFHL